MSEYAVVQVVIVGVGFLLVALGVPLWKGRVAPNSLYGFRTPRTLTNERLWYATNRAHGRELILFGAVHLGLVGVARGLSLPEMFLGVSVLVAELLMVLILMSSASRIAYAMDHEVEQEAAHEASPQIERAKEAARRASVSKQAL